MFCENIYRDFTSENLLDITDMNDTTVDNFQQFTIAPQLTVYFARLLQT